MTRTFSVLEISKAAYAEIEKLFLDLDYQHVFLEGDAAGLIDMHGIALTADPNGEYPEQGRWHYLQYEPLVSDTPKMGRLVIILVRASASKVPEWLFATYAGDGQFRIETQAQLQNDGSRRKLTSICHASFVTHWQYVDLPVEPS